MVWVFYLRNLQSHNWIRRIKWDQNNLFFWIDSQCSSHQENWHRNTEENCDQHKLEQGKDAATEKKSEGSSYRTEKIHDRERIKLCDLNDFKWNRV